MPAPPRDWTAIDWTKVDAATAARWIAVLPLAATEQHGPHLPFETDVMIGEAYLARVREHLPDATPATFLPIERIGISTEHIDFEGTQTLSTEAALARWKSIGESVARAGVKKIVIVTSHRPALREAADRIVVLRDGPVVPPVDMEPAAQAVQATISSPPLGQRAIA